MANIIIQNHGILHNKVLQYYLLIYLLYAFTLCMHYFMNTKWLKMNSQFYLVLLFLHLVGSVFFKKH